MIISGIIFVVVGVACVLVSGVILKEDSVLGSVSILALGLIVLSIGIVNIYNTRTDYFYKAYPEIARAEYKLDKIETLQKEISKLEKGLDR